MVDRDHTREPSDEPSAESSVDVLTARLSAYIDGDLSTAERAKVEALLQASPAAQRLLSELRALVSTAAALEDSPPQRDLWPGISVHLTRRRFAVPWPAAAALLLIAVGCTWWMSHCPRETSHMPRYLLLLRVNSGVGPPPSPEAMSALIARYAEWRREHALSGDKLSDDGGLLMSAASSQEMRGDGERIGGLFIIEAEDDTQARNIAATCPHLQYGGSIELRRIEDT